MLRFPLALGIVAVHAGYLVINFGLSSVELEVGRLYYFPIALLGESLGRLSTPLFFALSGYLLRRDGELGSHSYIRKLRSRVWTLLVPYLLWNIIVFAFRRAAGYLPHVGELLSNRSIQGSGANIVETLDHIFGITGYPINVPLWFLRDLIILVICSPLIQLLVKKVPFTYLAVVCASWLEVLPRLMPGEDPAPLTMRGVLFFSLGFFAADRGFGYKPNKLLRSIVCGLFAVIVLSQATILTLSLPVGVLPQIAAIMGVPVIVWIAQGIQARQGALARSCICMAKYSFFIFASHFLVISVMKKVFYTILHPAGGGETLLFLFLLPILISIAVCLLTYELLLRGSPGILALLTGMRLPKGTLTDAPERVPHNLENSSGRGLSGTGPV